MVIVMFCRICLNLNNWVIVVCLIRLICLSKYSLLLKGQPKCFAEIIGSIIVLLICKCLGKINVMRCSVV